MSCASLCRAVLLIVGLCVAPSLRGDEQPRPRPVVLVRDGYLVVPLPEEGVTVVARPAAQPGSRDTGWASWAQRGELIWRGEMTDSQGRIYNVRILPGYPVPGEHALEGWADAGRNLHEYVEARTWQDLGEHMKTTFRWGWKDAFWEFGIQGTGTAWKSHFEKARKRVQKRTFGWPLAYPWAFLAATFESSFRVVSGVAGGVGGTATAAVILPVAETAWPLAKATWHAGFDGVAVPVVAWTWQTAAAPLTSLFTAAPNPGRVDGLWMTLEKAHATGSSAPPLPPPEPVLADLEGYARELASLDRETQPQLEELARRRQKALKDLEATFEMERKQVLEARGQRLQAWLDLPGNREAVLRLAESAGNEVDLKAASTHLISRLVAGGMAEAEAKAVVGRLIRHPLQGPRSRTLNPKVDPATEILKTASPDLAPILVQPSKTP